MFFQTLRTDCEYLVELVAGKATTTAVEKTVRTVLSTIHQNLYRAEAFVGVVEIDVLKECAKVITDPKILEKINAAIAICDKQLEVLKTEAAKQQANQPAPASIAPAAPAPAAVELPAAIAEAALKPEAPSA